MPNNTFTADTFGSVYYVVGFDPFPLMAEGEQNDILFLRQNPNAQGDLVLDFCHTTDELCFSVYKDADQPGANKFASQRGARGLLNAAQKLENLHFFRDCFPKGHPLHGREMDVQDTLFVLEVTERIATTYSTVISPVTERPVVG